MKKCKKTLSGKHFFKDETILNGHEGYQKITPKFLFGCFLNGFIYEWEPGNLKLKKTGNKICKYCGIYKK